MKEKILVVEDSRTFRNYLYQQLNNAGYDVETAQSVAEAKIILERENESTDSTCLKAVIEEGKITIRPQLISE